MEKLLSNYHLALKKVWNNAVNSNANAIYSQELALQLEFQKSLLNRIQVGQYYYFVFNIFQGEFDFISQHVKDLLGYEQYEMTIQILLESIHPEDKSYFLNFEHKSIEFFKALPFDKVKKYKAQFDFRIKAKDNAYVRILHQVIQIDYDENNYYRSFGIHTDISHIKKKGIPCFSIIGMEGEPSYYSTQDTNVFTKSYDLFTKREREILKCIVEGRNSQEIAELLFISLHTVNNHRKNILKKANCKNPLDLVTKLIDEGWV